MPLVPMISEFRKAPDTAGMEVFYGMVRMRETQLLKEA